MSGSASDLQKLKKSFESSEFSVCSMVSFLNCENCFPDAYEAEQLLKEVDIHSVTGNLKSYLRELPEALFTDQFYQKVCSMKRSQRSLIKFYVLFQFFDTFNQFNNSNETARTEALLVIFNELPQPNKATISLILDHLIR